MWTAAGAEPTDTRIVGVINITIRGMHRDQTHQRAVGHFWLPYIYQRYSDARSPVYIIQPRNNSVINPKAQVIDGIQ